MLFEDELEINNSDHSRKCVVVPMKAYISLKDLWVPSQLLSNRNFPLKNSKHRSSIYHTLEKRKSIESLSIYYEEGNLDDNDVYTGETAPTCQNHLTSSIDKLSSLCHFSSDENAKLISLSETELNNDKQISNYFANSNKLMYESFSECLNIVSVSPETHNSHKKEYNVEQFVNLLDIINSDGSSSDESADNSSNIAATNIPPVEADSKEQSLINDENKYPNTVWEDVSGNDKQCGNKENCAEPLEDCQGTAVEELPKDKMDFISSKASLADSQDTFEKLPADQINYVNPEESSEVGQQAAFEEVHAENMDIENSKVLLDDDQCTAVKELPIAYKRPPLEEEKLTKKQRQQNKKKKNASHKNVQLADFIKKVEEDGCEMPQKDEFYESLVRRGICVPQDIDSYVDETVHMYSSFKSAGIEYFGAKGRKKENVALSMESFPDTLLKSSLESIPEKIQSEEEIEIEDQSAQSLQSDSSLQDPEVERSVTTLVLCNVSKEITKDTIEDVMCGYGELTDVRLESHGDIVQVYVKLILENSDIDWVIECLDNTELFGATGGVVKCYKL